MAASITLAGETLFAQKQAAGQVLTVSRFVFANVPGLDPSAPVNRAGKKPPTAQVVYTAPVDKTGFVNPNQVIYSVVVDSGVGDWDFNWIGLESEENVLVAVAYVPLQQKRKNVPPLQIGNNVTRNFLVEYSGAQAITGITVDASTWQHDFSVRLKGIDERERLSNRDVFGRACFLDTSLQMEQSFGLYQLKAGVAYIEGVRIQLDEPVHVQLSTIPAKAWLDVTLVRQGSDVTAQWSVAFGNSKSDYQDGNGTPHYLIELANISGGGEITDLRLTQPITSALVEHFAAKVGDYPSLRARATTKGDVGLGNLPNAKSDDPDTDSSDILATTKALKALITQMDERLVGQVTHFDLDAPPPGFLRANGAAVSRSVYARLFAKIGTRHGAGNGSTTFNLPDARGLFIRSLDDGRNLDPGRALGSTQADETRSHTHIANSAGAGGHSHTANSSDAGGHTHTSRASDAGTHTHSASSSAAGNHSHTARADAQGAHAHTVKEGEPGVHWNEGETLTSGDDMTTRAESYSTTSTEGNHSHNITVDAAGSHNHPIAVEAVGNHTHTVTVDGVAHHAHVISVIGVSDHSHVISVNATGGSETRPQNIAFNAFIKF